MDRTERFYKIDQLLHEHRFASFARLQDTLGVSRATLKRDLQYLRDRLHAPIVYDRDNGGYHFTATGTHAPKYELPGLWFNSSEIYALLSMQNLLEEVQPGLLGPHIAPLQTRLKSLLESHVDESADIAMRIRIVHAAKRRSDLKWFELIATSLLSRRRLLLRHWNRGRNEETEREVSPQRLVYYRDNWYLDAWCHLRDEIRSFGVDAIRSASQSDKRAKEVSQRELDRVLGAGYGIFSGASVQWAKLRFSPESARWVAAEEWHPKQKSSTDKSGRYVLEVPYSNPTELIMDILRHGSGVEVLGPKTLRDTVRQELSAAVAAYS